MLSTYVSGPLAPPGFKNQIPPEKVAELEYKQRRKSKLRFKKKKQMKLVEEDFVNDSDPMVNKVLDVVRQLGMVLSMAEAEVKDWILRILEEEKQEWEDAQMT